MKSIFQTPAYKMFASLKRVNVTKVYSYACVKLDGVKSIIMYRHGIPYSIRSTLMDAIMPLHTKHDLVVARRFWCSQVDLTSDINYVLVGPTE